MNSYEHMDTLHSFAKAHPNIIYINRIIGLADFDIDIEVPTEEDFVKIIKEIRMKFDKDIKNYSYLTIRKVHKISYFPE